MMNQMFMERNVSAQQKHGVIVCLPKSSDPTTLADIRPVALLNTDYKIMARIIAYRLRPSMEEQLHPSQFCVRLLHRPRRCACYCASFP